ncbi:MAG: hypothetical protein LBC03_00645, partial [Nitrososphaerota archaeon]|nr:hypothetical protein [Nitrososphaerota archaeon]
MFNKQKVAVKSYTYVKNGLKIMLALIPGLPSETKLIDPILELVYNNMAWAGLFKNKITMEQRVALKQAVDGAFKTMYKTRPTIRINLPKEARNELEEYITNLAPKELVSRTVNKNVINILSKHSPEKDLEQITKTFVDSIEQQLVTNTPMSDLLNHTKMEILQEYLEAEIKALKGELKAVKEDVKAVKEKTEYLEKLVPNRESILNKAFSCSKERYEYLRDTWFAHIEFDERLFTGVNLLPIMLKPANSEEGATLYDTVKKHEGNFIFIGEGGIGKTTSLLQIWEKWLSEEKELPLYVPLNECNTTQEEHPITAYIKQWYLVDLNELNDKPVILLLDGFNELSERRDTVVREIKNLAAQTQTRRIVLTSRYNFIPTYNLKGFATYDIQPLRSEVIKAFWEETQLKIPELQNIALPEGWETLLSTPMMLTLFANTCTVQKELEEKQLFPFKPSKTKGELIYNYLLRQLAKLYIDNQQTDLPTAYVALFWFAPYVAWQMERTNQFSIDTDKCEQQLSEYLLRKQSFIQKSAKHFLEKACETIPYWNNYNSASKLLHILEKQVYLLRKENGSYTFQHQHFRDFLSALHIDNALEKAFTELAVSGTFSVPEEVTGRVFPSHISDMLGGYYGDYQNQEKRIVETNLHKLLDQLRCLNCTQVGFAVNNIIGVWRMAREDRIVGENLTKLDLSKVLMNGIFFSKHSLATQFDGSKISDATFLPQGHTRYVKSAMYSPDGSHILTASGDKTAKEWDRVTGECLRTFQGHHHTIESAVYSPDGSHILTASRDTTVKEWSRETGECLCTFQGHHHAVLSAAYSPDGSYVLTGSVDRT